MMHGYLKNTMFYGDKPQDTRQLFFLSWQKYWQKQPMTPLESQIVDVILMHPEYHVLFEKTKPEQEQIYSAEFGAVNPFLHMGLHLAIRDQVSMDRPVGMKDIYHALLNIKKDAMVVEHQLMECLEDCLWQAQSARALPNEISYINACRQLLNKGR